MHIIAGRFKGFPIPAALRGTRPTTDRTKEAIFSHLESEDLLSGARVLDLFAGTGALGFEALSRGAQSLVAVESSGRVAGLLSRSAAGLRHHPAWDQTMDIRVSRNRAERFVRPLSSGHEDAGLSEACFDLVFMDPPYDLSTEDCQSIMTGLTAQGMVDDGGMIVLERSTRTLPPTAPDGWAIDQARTYGETAVYYLTAR